MTEQVGMGAPVLEVAVLAKRYGDLQTVHDVSFEVAPGEIIGLLGPNGAGKTTTVECVQGLRTHDAGTVRILGRDPPRDAAAQRSQVGAQLQESALPARLRVAEALDLQWRGLLELREHGKARAIGVSNFGQVHIEELRAAGLPLPDANQIELHPWSQKRQLVDYSRGNSIGVIAYSSLVPLLTWRTAARQDSAKIDVMRAVGESLGSPFAAMASKDGVSEAQVLLRWGVQQGYTVLPKSTNPERIVETADLLSFSLDDQDMTSIAQMDRGTGVAWAIGDPTTFA